MPPEIQRAAREAFARFTADPSHPGLRFKPLWGHDDAWSVRVTISYRAVGIRNEDAITWYWVGSHAEFDRDFG